MSFMEPQVTDKQRWLVIDGNCGIVYVPMTELGANRAQFLLLSDESKLATAQVYYDGTPDSTEIISGFGARMSAPGYLDCTEWTVFDTVDEAEAYLKENYMDDDEEDEEETEYTVVVGNIGNVYSGTDKEDAKSTFNVYVEKSKSNEGRAAGESVTLFAGEEIEREYPGTIETE